MINMIGLNLDEKPSEELSVELFHLGSNAALIVALGREIVKVLHDAELSVVGEILVKANGRLRVAVMTFNFYGELPFLKNPYLATSTVSSIGSSPKLKSTDKCFFLFIVASLGEGLTVGLSVRMCV